MHLLFLLRSEDSLGLSFRRMVHNFHVAHICKHLHRNPWHSHAYLPTYRKGGMAAQRLET